MLGGLFALGVLDLSEQNLFGAMQERWTDRLVEINRTAYGLGHQAVSESLGEST
jgi:Pyruvate/2-oxoacid:ferredoxin oxidoreductase gamma subunit